jgi:hypothetical protein
MQVDTLLGTWVVVVKCTEKFINDIGNVEEINWRKYVLGIRCRNKYIVRTHNGQIQYLHIHIKTSDHIPFTAATGSAQTYSGQALPGLQTGLWQPPVVGGAGAGAGGLLGGG